ECRGAVVEEAGLDDPAVLDPQQEEVATLERTVAPRPRRGRERDGVHVAREDVDEFRAERAATQLPELREVREDRRLALVLPRDRGGAGHVPDRVLGDQLLHAPGVFRMEGAVE